MESLRDMLLNIFKGEWDKTSTALNDECADWTEFYNHWIDLIKSIIEIVPSTTQKQSLIAIRFLEMNRDILWSLFSTMVGAYETAIRELRFWLEATLQAYLVDKKGGLSKLSMGVEKTTGARLINACGFKEPYHSALRSIYKELCKFVHPTKQELNPALLDPRVSFNFDESIFRRNRELFRKTCDAILFIVMSAYQGAARHYSRKHLTRESLIELDYRLSLLFLKELYNKSDEDYP